MVNKLNLTCIRHAKSIFNQTGIRNFNSDISEDGKIQARSLTGEFDLVICSPLQRSQKTLEFSNIKTRDILITPLCREKFDGNIINLLPSEDHLSSSIESEDEIQKRIHDFKFLLINLSKIYQRICIISHFDFIKRLLNIGKFINNCEAFNVELSY